MTGEYITLVPGRKLRGKNKCCEERTSQEGRLAPALPRQRGQAPLPDLFSPSSAQTGGKPPFLTCSLQVPPRQGASPLPDLFSPGSVPVYPEFTRYSLGFNYIRRQIGVSPCKTTNKSTTSR